MENWKPIRGYEGLYEVSDRGRVRSLDRVVRGRNGVDGVRYGRVLKLHKRASYLFIGLHKGAQTVSFDVHRLVADAFVPGRTEERNEVNHINLNKLDNRASNLEWVSHTENVRHAFKSGACVNHISGRVKKAILCVETGRRFPSSYDAARYLNETKFSMTKDTPTMARNIRWRVITGKGLAYGFHWSSTDEESSTTIPKGSTGKRPEMGGPSVCGG